MWKIIAIAHQVTLTEDPPPPPTHTHRQLIVLTLTKVLLIYNTSKLNLKYPKPQVCPYAPQLQDNLQVFNYKPNFIQPVEQT